mmetsp:Transcript_14621/g.41128  ORF Transcript_14621/g.41128 Transcript_14621/m.41128 type:complete len:501 (-) Transcript_14621:86-1588(-)|eukprot:CAMPEP_0117647902 /NCGR_PEP_ID=MMETSP0804-20121206/97_1 /TAXON_ID=1074897 /ORGANISM="Tetraselmis astigmatica, Strain CCMP880" /LENGTH=500 /DNA_ID=CAMNT_0005453425 /DNA_START=165 /DNA_END=1667 /DNA_ORIENTATION=+
MLGRRIVDALSQACRQSKQLGDRQAWASKVWACAGLARPAEHASHRPIGCTSAIAPATSWQTRSNCANSSTIAAIPFTVSAEEAKVAQRRFHTRHFFQSVPLAAYKAKDCYLPFWALHVTVETYLQSVDLAYERVEMGRDRKLRTATEWRNVYIGKLLHPITYGSHEEQLQVPAGKKYHSSDLQRLRPGEAIRLATILSDSMLQSTIWGTTRRVGAFEISSRDALSSVQSWLRFQEERRCEALVSQLIQDMHKRMNVNMEMRIISAKHMPLYVPAYIFSHCYSVSGIHTKLRTFVSGFDASKVSGVQVLDPLKVAATTAGAVGIGSLALGAASLSSPVEFGLVYVSLPAIAAGYAALYYPVALDLWRRQMSRLQMAVRQFIMQSVQKSTRGTWQQHGGGGYNTDAGSRRAGWQQQRHGGSGAAAERDPLGLYAALGVAEDASMDEIKAAFRGLALKHHPDRVTDPTAKESAAAMFKQISSAYQVLRSEQRRAKYDATGTV